jgi:hypothetical protein
MRWFTMASAILASAAMAVTLQRAQAAEPSPRISGPYTHENLSIYLLHGASANGPVPLTLAEALAKGGVRVHETGNVNALQVENIGGEPVFIQSGDIVKGGQQDRVLTMSLLLPAGSGKIAIDSFCVEQGRWAPRGKEDVKSFASSAEALPSRVAKLAMRAPARPQAANNEPAQQSASLDGRRNRTEQRQMGDPASTAGVADKQRKVWDEVANIQHALSARLGATVTAPTSATSLQLTLENEKLKDARAAYLKVLGRIPDGQSDVVGFVFAIDGRINSADQYPSAALFAKMWPKLVAASVTEAIGTRREGATVSAPPAADVEVFLASARSGDRHEANVAGLMDQETRDSPGALYVEARAHKGAWVHRNYVAK